MENNAEIASSNSSPPEEQLIQMIQGMWAIQAVDTAARCGIADALAKSPPQSPAFDRRARPYASSA